MWLAGHFWYRVIKVLDRYKIIKIYNVENIDQNHKLLDKVLFYLEIEKDTNEDRKDVRKGDYKEH